jgi:hypothetical protein
MGIWFKRAALALAAAGTMAVAETAKADTVINFDNYAAGTVLSGSTFDSIGVHFNQTLQAVSGIGEQSSSLPNSAINFTSYADDISGSFVSPVTSVSYISVFAGDAGGDIDTVTLRGYDAANQLVATDTFTALSAQLLEIAGAGIVRFEIDQQGAVAIDDFTFRAETSSSTESVPLPGVAAAGVALIGFGKMRRRRNVAAI